MIDCSHANSDKNPDLQPAVFESLIQQSTENKAIIGGMIESNLKSGNQKFPQPKEALEYGVSITDGCIDWETTEKILREAHHQLNAQ